MIGVMTTSGNLPGHVRAYVDQPQCDESWPVEGYGPVEGHAKEHPLDPYFPSDGNKKTECVLVGGVLMPRRDVVMGGTNIMVWTRPPFAVLARQRKAGYVRKG